MAPEIFLEDTPMWNNWASLRRIVCFAPLAVLALNIGAASEITFPSAAAVAQSSTGQLPAPPASGMMGFVVHHFVPSVIQGKDACPDGLNIRVQEYFLASLPPDERERIQRKEHEAEFMKRFMAYVSRPDGSNFCTQYPLYPDRPLVRTVQSKFAWGF